MRSRGAVGLEAWAAGQGGVRAAARVLGVAAATLSRWVNGHQAPRGDGDRGPAWLEERTGVPAADWDVLDGQPSPPAVAGPEVPPGPPRGLRGPPARGTAGPAEPSPPPAEEVDDVGDDQPPATLEALQARARQIPGELQRLRYRIASGATAVNAGEVMARMLEREARAVNAAITSAGTATVEEVARAEAMILDITSSCATCREQALTAIRRARGE
ncbi:hypothetical protein [Sorangium cellulosum]|uniref:Uncharacterized protein n=1 Tax=Sorangium cellulosum TaxID=56 RepID=A0A150Q992_SORCE|nr:hypothetical protein [Sorangium cellulosum]KYF64545.1 hypothetical protein BE15_04575 [Sorangium cellulosum]